MKKNELYIITSPLFPTPERDQSRLVVIRDFDRNKVTFSVCSDEQPNLEQPNLDYSVVRFYISTFTISRSLFENIFAPIGNAIPAMIGGLS